MAGDTLAPRPALLRLWAFTVRPGREADFIRVYGPGGDWARLFSKGDGYLCTELWRAPDGRFITLDRWRSAADWARFKTAFADAYAALDRACADLTDSETDLGDCTAP